LQPVLAFANKFCCEGLKSACDGRLAAMVRGVDDALSLVDLGLEEASTLLVAACLQAFLRELPKSLANPDVAWIAAALHPGGPGPARRRGERVVGALLLPLARGHGA
jgi:hypothetical protein